MRSWIKQFINLESCTNWGRKVNNSQIYFGSNCTAISRSDAHHKHGSPYMPYAVMYSNYSKDPIPCITRSDQAAECPIQIARRSNITKPTKSCIMPLRNVTLWNGDSLNIGSEGMLDAIMCVTISQCHAGFADDPNSGWAKYYTMHA